MKTLFKNIPVSKAQVTAALVFGLMFFLVIGLFRGQPLGDFSSMLSSVWGLVLATLTFLEALFGVLSYLFVYMLLSALALALITVIAAWQNRSVRCQ